MMNTCSIVIPTLNRHVQVMRLVADLLNQSYPHVDIIVVDQSDEKPAERIASDKVRYISIDQKSTPHARNVGIAASRGDAVVFFDDDCEIKDAHLISKVMEFFATHPDYAGLAMTVTDVNKALNRENQRIDSRIMQVSRSGKVFPNAIGEEQDVTAPRGGGMAFRIEQIKHVGGFDERYVGNAMREETDFSLRIVRHGGKIRYVPELAIVHLALPSGGSRTADRLQWYKDFFANELLFQMTHFPKVSLFVFFARKIRPILSCMFWYGKARPAWLFAPLVGFAKGFGRFRKGMTPYGFSSHQ